MYFISFPITMFKLWPINEGPSLFLISWFLYFVLVVPKPVIATLIAVMAPIFRAHIYFIEVSLFLYSIARKKWGILVSAASSFMASIFGLWAYLQLFPANQPRLAKEVFSGAGVFKILQAYLLATVHLFVPEGGTQWAFDKYDNPISSVIGALLVSLGILGFLKMIRAQSSGKEAGVFGLSTFFVSSVGVVGSLIIISRFHTVGYLWLLLALYSYLDSKSAKLSRGFFLTVVALNIVCVVVFWVTRSTDPAYKATEGIKRLSEKAEGYPVVYEHDCLPVHPRQIYAYFRRPTVDLAKAPLDSKFIMLTDHPERLGNRFAGCLTEEFLDNPVTLMKVDCTRKTP
jgi:hypothetical protein